MDEHQALKKFCEHTGSAELSVDLSGFRRALDEALTPPPRGRITVEDRLNILITWFDTERAEPCKLSPLRVIETYRFSRAWIIFAVHEQKHLVLMGRLRRAGLLKEAGPEPSAG